MRVVKPQYEDQVYVIEGSTRRWVPDPKTLAYLADEDQIETNDEVLSYRPAAPMPSKQRNILAWLVRVRGQNKVYALNTDSKTKHHVRDWQTRNKLVGGEGGVETFFGPELDSLGFIRGEPIFDTEDAERLLNIVLPRQAVKSGSILLPLLKVIFWGLLAVGNMYLLYDVLQEDD